VPDTLVQSINQLKHICIAPYVANELEAHKGRDWTECSRSLSNSSVFKLRLKVLISCADSEFETEGALTLIRR